MPVFLSNIITAVISGLIVALLSAYLFGGLDSKPSVSLQVAKLNYDRALVDSIHEDYVAAIERHSFDEPTLQRLEEIGLHVVRNGSLGFYGSLELLELENNEASEIVDILVEGRDISLSVIERDGRTEKVHRSDFSETLRLAPGDEIQILNVSRENYSYGQSESENIVVSIDGEAILSPDTDSLAYDLFGSIHKISGFMSFMIIIFGVVALPLIVVSIASSFVPVQYRERLLRKLTSVSSYRDTLKQIELIETEDPEKYNKIME